MQRPKIIYLISIWCFVALMIQVSHLSRWVRPFPETGQYPPTWLATLPTVAFVFVIWQIVGLVRLGAFHRWFAAIFLGYWTLILTWNCGSIFWEGAPHPVSLLIVWSVTSTLNVASVWFLSRRTFREFAADYVIEQQKEKHSRQMQKASQKAMAKDIRIQSTEH